MITLSLIDSTTWRMTFVPYTQHIVSLASILSSRSGSLTKLRLYPCAGVSCFGHPSVNLFTSNDKDPEGLGKIVRHKSTAVSKYPWMSEVTISIKMNLEVLRMKGVSEVNRAKFITRE